MADILSSDHWDDYLSDEIRQRSDLQSRVDVAELEAIETFRNPTAGESPMTFDGVGSKGVVTLRGWETDSNGDPDVEAMPDELVKLLRQYIADLVHHRLDKMEREDVDSVSQGDRSVSYSSTPSLSSQALSVLTSRYDYSEPWIGRW